MQVLFIFIFVFSFLSQPCWAENFLTRPQPMTEAQRADKAEIMELLNFERFCRDNALWEEMRTCYAEDSIVDISWYHGSGRLRYSF